MLADLLALFTTLLEADPRTRLIFTSREALPGPFDRHTLRLDHLPRDEAIKLVEQHMPAPPPPDAAAKIEELVEAVRGHARSLVLLAPAISRQGVTVTAAVLSRLMAELHDAHTDDRERSFVASVELSLRRLPPAMRHLIRPLAVFQGEVDLDVLALMFADEGVRTLVRLDPTSAGTSEQRKTLVNQIAAALLQTNLAQLLDYDHLRLDPALCPYLARELTSEKTAALTACWANGMVQLVNFLYQHSFQDAQLSATLTRLELPNLLHLLEVLAAQAGPETTLEVATRVEQLLAELGYPRLLQRVVKLREQASRDLGGGLTDTQFRARQVEIERLLQAGQVQPAYRAAQQLLAQSQQPRAQVSAYNQAMAVNLVGQVLYAGGAAGEALAHFREAHQRFEQEGEAGARMASVTLLRQGDCLRQLGRLEEAAQAYEKRIKMGEKLKDDRGVAAGQSNLATVRLVQRRYAEALATYEAAKQIFAGLGEPKNVATIWHQIGNVHYEAGNLEAAETAYREALALRVKHQYRTDEASTLNQLGNLYDNMGRLEEAVIFYRQAADIHVQLADQAREGRDRNNLADTLIKLRRYDEARAEIRRAIVCKEPYGHAATPWNTWAILHDLEQAVGNPAAAAQAKAEARRLYLAYRRDGGENHSGGGRLCADFLQAIRAGQTAKMAEVLQQLAVDPERSDTIKALVSTLQAILAGARDPALADNPVLYYHDAAEVELLLAALGPVPPGG